MSAFCSEVSEKVEIYFLKMVYFDSYLNFNTYINTYYISSFLFHRSKHGLVVSGQNRVYMAGGEYPDGSASKAVWRYDPTLDIWQEVESMQTPRSELGNVIQA